MKEDSYEEGGKCPECSGKLIYPPVCQCFCHISPPCSYCTDNKLTCDECGWEAPEIINEYKYRAVAPGIAERYSTRPSIELGDGKRIFDFDYDSSSGSTMVYSGKYKGDVSASDIIKAFGDGTFGHRGPSLRNGKFSYMKITD